MRPQKILVILGVLWCILVHFEAYRETHKASREETHHHNHHYLLSYWNTGNHLHRLSRHNGTNTYTKGTLPNYFFKISVNMTLSLGPPPLSIMAKVADSDTWT